MGEDKSLLPFSLQILIQFQYERLKPYFKDIYISSKTINLIFKNKKNFLDENKDIFSPFCIKYNF